MENSGLASGYVHAVAARAFGEHDEMKLFASATELLKFVDAIRVVLPAFQQKTDLAAEKFFESVSVPDRFVAEHDDGITIRPPAKCAEQDGVEQADVVADKEITLLRVKPLHTARAAQVGQGEKEIRTEAETPLDEFQSGRDATSVCGCFCSVLHWFHGLIRPLGLLQQTFDFCLLT